MRSWAGTVIYCFPNDNHYCVPCEHTDNIRVLPHTGRGAICIASVINFEILAQY